MIADAFQSLSRQPGCCFDIVCLDKPVPSLVNQRRSGVVVCFGKSDFSSASLTGWTELTFQTFDH